ncbi:MAG: hypothetical protein AAF633_28425 [Chloroflexota bacterium]
MTSVIAGARVTAHLESNLGAIGWELSAKALERLNIISAPPVRYPQNMEKGMVARRASAVKPF